MHHVRQSPVGLTQAVSFTAAFVCGLLVYLSAASGTLARAEDQPAAAESTKPIEDLEGGLQMFVNASVTLSSKDAIAQVSVNDPELLDAATISANEVRLTAKQVGMTQVKLSLGEGESEEKLRTIDVSIVANPSEQGTPGDASQPLTASAQTYELVYRFMPGEKIRWEVEHQTNVRTTISGTTQTVETLTRSVKVWQVTNITPDGQVTFENSVERVDLKQRISGREDIHYNSETDETPPVGFEAFAQSVGVPLFAITMDAHGDVIKREPRKGDSQSTDTQLTIPLPKERVPVGHVWSFPYTIDVTLKTGEVRKIPTRQRFALESVQNDVATISVATQVLKPVNDPEIQAQLIQKAFTGKVKFDINLGRILDQQMDLDDQVIGFSGEASSLRYVTRFTERLMTSETSAAAKPENAGPQPPPKTARKSARPQQGRRRR